MSLCCSLFYESNYLKKQNNGQRQFMYTKPHQHWTKYSLIMNRPQEHPIHDLKACGRNKTFIAFSTAASSANFWGYIVSWAIAIFLLERQTNRKMGQNSPDTDLVRQVMDHQSFLFLQFLSPEWPLRSLNPLHINQIQYMLSIKKIAPRHPKLYMWVVSTYVCT